jgi:hypothetical protein
MSVQTAELQILGFDFREELQISCSLMNIARGNCNIKLKSVDNVNISMIGSLEISIKRPVMNGEIFFQKEKFDHIKDLFKTSFPRPVTMIILLDQDLLINKVGDLILDKEKKVKILDISWNIPLN